MKKGDKIVFVPKKHIYLSFPKLFKNFQKLARLTSQLLHLTPWILTKTEQKIGTKGNRRKK